MSWIIISMAVILGLLVLGLVLFMIFRPKTMKMEMDYRTFFVIGVAWLAVGIIGIILYEGQWYFLIMGAVFLALGLGNYKKWKKQKKWSELTPEEQRFKLVLMAFAVILLIAGLVLFLLIL